MIEQLYMQYIYVGSDLRWVMHAKLGCMDGQGPVSCPEQNLPQI